MEYVEGVEEREDTASQEEDCFVRQEKDQI